MAGSARSAFTLLETMLALAIALVVVALVYSVFHSVHSTVELQQHLAAGPERTVAALAEVSDDLARAFVGSGDTSTRFHLVQAAGRADRSELLFCTIRADSSERDPRWADAVIVGFEVIEEAQGLALIRFERPLTGPGSVDEPVTNRLATGLAGWQVEVFDGDSWSSTWPPERERDRLPRAARLSLRDADDEVRETEVLIGTGATIAPSMEREALGAIP